jgi:hypothetical protein
VIILVDISHEKKIERCSICGKSGVRLWREMTGILGRDMDEVHTFCRRCARESKEYHKENTVTWGCNHVLGKLLPAVQPNNSAGRFVRIDYISESDEYQDWLKLEE